MLVEAQMPEKVELNGPAFGAFRLPSGEVRIHFDPSKQFDLQDEATLRNLIRDGGNAKPLHLRDEVDQIQLAETAGTVSALFGQIGQALPANVDNELREGVNRVKHGADMISEAQTASVIGQTQAVLKGSSADTLGLQRAASFLAAPAVIAAGVAAAGAEKQVQDEVSQKQVEVDIPLEVLGACVREGYVDSVEVGPGSASNLFRDENGDLIGPDEVCEGPMIVKPLGGADPTRDFEFNVPEEGKYPTTEPAGADFKSGNFYAMANGPVEQEPVATPETIVAQLRVELDNGAILNPTLQRIDTPDSQIQEMLGRRDINSYGELSEITFEGITFRNRVIYVVDSTGAGAWYGFDSTLEDGEIISTPLGYSGEDVLSFLGVRTDLRVEQESNFRSDTALGNDTKIGTVRAGELVTPTGSPVEANGYTWLPVINANGEEGVIADANNNGRFGEWTRTIDSGALVLDLTPEQVQNYDRNVIAAAMVSPGYEELLQNPELSPELVEMKANWEITRNAAGELEVRDTRYSWLGPVAVGRAAIDENGRQMVEFEPEYEIQGNVRLVEMSLSEDEDGAIGKRPAVGYVRPNDSIYVEDMGLTLNLMTVVSADRNDPHHTMARYEFTQNFSDRFDDLARVYLQNFRGYNITIRVVDDQDPTNLSYLRGDSLDNSTFLQQQETYWTNRETGERFLASARGAEPAKGNNLSFNILYNRDLPADMAVGMTNMITGAIVNIRSGWYLRPGEVHTADDTALSMYEALGNAEMDPSARAVSVIVDE